MQELFLGPLHLYSKCAALDCCGLPNKWKGAVSVSVHAIGSPLPYLNCIVGPHWERMCLLILLEGREVHKGEAGFPSMGKKRGGNEGSD